MSKRPDSLNGAASHDEEIRMENEFLKMKLTAEHGAIAGNTSKVPPLVENQFLKNIIQIEEAYSCARQTTIFRLLGHPQVKLETALNDQQLETELESFVRLMEEKNIVLDFMGDYDNRTKYRFLTEEFIHQETSDLVIPGMVTHFLYEEFHPNHRLDIETRAAEFLEGLFQRNIDKAGWELAEEFIMPDKTSRKCADVIGQLQAFFDCYHRFIDHQYIIRSIDYELNEESGRGQLTGELDFTGIIDRRERVRFEGEFKLIFSCEFGWWSICYFMLPGFELG